MKKIFDLLNTIDSTKYINENDCTKLSEVETKYILKNISKKINSEKSNPKEIKDRKQYYKISLILLIITSGILTFSNKEARANIINTVRKVGMSIEEMFKGQGNNDGNITDTLTASNTSENDEEIQIDNIKVRINEIIAFKNLILINYNERINEEEYPSGDLRIEISIDGIKTTEKPLAGRLLSNIENSSNKDNLNSNTTNKVKETQKLLLVYCDTEDLTGKDISINFKGMYHYNKYNKVFDKVVKKKINKKLESVKTIDINKELQVDGMNFSLRKIEVNNLFSAFFIESSDKTLIDSITYYENPTDDIDEKYDQTQFYLLSPIIKTKEKEVILNPPVGIIEEGTFKGVTIIYDKFTAKNGDEIIISEENNLKIEGNIYDSAKGTFIKGEEIDISIE